MSQPKQKFQLNLPGLLKVLAEHLYSTRKVAIRELIQNAHDSCIRRQSEENPVRYRPRIDIRYAADENIIVIEDNGAGMTDDEITTYLTTIGNSYTRELGSKLEFLSPQEASMLIGQFGLGFLSAFLIASEVTLMTRSYKTEQGFRWYCDGGEDFEITPTEKATIGTSVEIRLKPEAEFLLEHTILDDTIRKYADFLSIPIHLNGDSAPLNLMTPPWEVTYGKENALRDYIERAFHQTDVLCVIELHDEEIDLGHDTIKIPLQGFVFIPSQSVVSLREYGDLRVYIRKMFITEDHRHLMPRWARFFRGVIDCPVLQPTASREDIHQEDNYFAVQQALENQLLIALRTIAKEQPDLWRRIIAGHTDLVLGWIVANDEFFEQVSDNILLRTTRGMLNMPNYLAQSDQTVYFVTREIGSLQEQLLGEGYEVPVIDAAWFAVRSFLEKYALWHGGLRLVQMDGDSRQLLRPVTEEKPYEHLLAFFRKRNIKAQVAAFKPISVPALMMYPKNAETIREARQALDSGELSTPFAAMVEAYLERQQAETGEDDIISSARGTLHLNASCPLIVELSEKPPHSLDSILDLLYQVARLFAARNISPIEVSQAFESVTESIRGLMRS